MQAAPAGGIDGLIVKLKDAPAHERMVTLSAHAREAETGRVQQLLLSERLTQVRTRPAGRDARHLDFGRRMSEAEAREIAERLRARTDVEWVELNVRERLLQAAVVPNDLYYAYNSPSDLGQWWLRPEGETAGSQAPSYGAPGVQRAWSVTTGVSSAVVAVLDSGTTSHADLSGRLLPGRDFVSEAQYSNDGDGWDADPSDPGDAVSAGECGSGEPAQDSSWHGTIVSGIVAAATNNGIGVAGVNWNGRVLPVRVAGKCGASVLDITDGMRWAAGLAVCRVENAQGVCLEYLPTNSHPARIINISFGGTGSCSGLYQTTIDELAAHGVVVIAAAGNELGTPTRPAKCPGVVGVAALARDGLKAAYSNFGPQLSIATVGGDPNVDDGLLTLLNTGTTVPGSDTYGNVFGTSFATPVVSGVVSLMLSANPALSRQQIITGLKSTARPHVQSSSGVPVCSSANPDVCVCTTSTCGAGVLDADGAVRYAQSAPLDTGSPAGDGGGGALGLAWLSGLALAVWRLAALRQRSLQLKAARRV